MIFNSSKYNSHWQDKKLSDLGSFRRGKSRHRPRNDPKLFKNGVYPLVQTGEVKQASLYLDSHHSCYNEFGLSQSEIWPKNTLCITIAANIAETALLSYPMCFPDSVVGFNAYQKESSEIFMHYVFTYIRRAIQNSASGSIQDNINIDYLTGLKFKVPLKAYQDKIVSVLSVLDYKIDLNNRINAELEAMAKTLYDYWFVQFDFPDANGKPYKTSGGKMEYNATLKREVPVGWKIKKISEIALVKAGGDKPSNCVDFRSNEYSIPIFSNGISSEGLYGYTNISVVNKPSITVSARGTIGYSVLRLKPFFPIIRLLVLTPYQDNALKFLEETIKRFSFENSGSVQQQLTVPQISEMSVLYPIEKLLNIYTKRIWPLIKKIELIKEQNSELQQLRDWLLPLLMNGQVTVK